MYGFQVLMNLYQRESDINKIIGIKQTDESKQEICATYAIVSSQKQKVSGRLKQEVNNEQTNLFKF